MQFEPQCKTVADLHREWARVLDMCSNASVNPYACVKNTASKYNSISINDIFNIIPEWSEFAIAIVEGKPVFRGDTLYCKTPSMFATFSPIEFDSINNVLKSRSGWCISTEGISWNPTKPKTFTLESIPVPYAGWHTERCANEFSMHFKFKTSEEATAMEKIVLGQLSKQM